MARFLLCVLGFAAGFAAGFAPRAGPPGGHARVALGAEGTFSCDSCGVDPIVGSRLSSKGYDICASCATHPDLHPGFVALQWTIHPAPVDGLAPAGVSPAAAAPAVAGGGESAMPTASFATQQAPAAPRPGEVRDAAGKVVIDEGTSGRFTKFAPENADEFENDVEYRAAVLAKVIEDREERRFSGKPVGSQASDDYLKNLQK